MTSIFGEGRISWAKTALNESEMSRGNVELQWVRNFISLSPEA
jgi:hypothetical protein